jgi:hypothetical protein
MRETKPLNYRVDDAITEAYEKMLGVEDLVEEVEVFSKSEENLAQLDEVKSITKSDVQKAVRGAKGKVPIGREYILNTDSNSSVAPMVNQMKSALTKSNVTDSKLGKGFEVKTKKGSVLIKPEVAELYLKSRDALPRPIQKNMDMIAEKDVDGLFQMLNDAMNDLLKGRIESYIEEQKEDSDDIPVAEKENEIVFERKKYMITQGIANAFRKPDLLKGNMIVKKVCEECHFHMPAFAGRYPDNCPLCGTPFKVEFKNQEKVKEKIAVYEGDKCLFVAEEIKEGKFKEISLEIDMIIDDVVSKVKSKELKNNRDLMKLLKDMKSGKKLPSGVRKSTVQDNFSKIAAGVANKLRKERIKF